MEKLVSHRFFSYKIRILCLRTEVLFIIGIIFSEILIFGIYIGIGQIEINKSQQFDFSKNILFIFKSTLALNVQPRPGRVGGALLFPSLVLAPIYTMNLF